MKRTDTKTANRPGGAALRAAVFFVLVSACLGLVGGPENDGGATVDGGSGVGVDAGGTGGTGATGGTGGASGGGGAVTGGGTGGGTITPDAGRCAASFCEDFERFDAGRPPSSPWSTTTTTGGAVIVDASRSHRGHQSAKVTTDGQAAYRQAYLALKAPFFPVSGNGFYGRAWLYLTEAPAMTTHWTNISGEGTAMNGATAFQAYVRYGGQVAKHLMANYDSTVFASDCWRQSSVPFPEARWACFEWHFDGPTRTMELWVDGVAVTALTINGTGDGCIGSDLQNQWIFPQFDTLRLGWEHYQTSIAIELWVDDVALDTGRVGCE